MYILQVIAPGPYSPGMFAAVNPDQSYNAGPFLLQKRVLQLLAIQKRQNDFARRTLLMVLRWPTIY